MKDRFDYGLPGRVRGLALLGSLMALFSMALPLSYDEAFWLGISRMVQEGAVLYETAIDNKSPLIYGFFWLLDILPGPFVVARALIVGATALFVGWVVRSLAGSPRPQSWVAPLIAVTVVFLAAFRLQTELIAAPFAVVALRSAIEGRAERTAVFSLVATCVTPLAAGMIPASLYLARRTSSRNAWRRATLMTVAAGWAIFVVVVSVDNLRFGLIELNLASRSGLTPSSGAVGIVYSLTLAAMSLLPVAVLGWALRWKARTIGMLAAVALPAVVAGFGFPHYWILVAVTAGVLGSHSVGSLKTFPSPVAMGMSLIPIVLWTLLQVGPAIQVSNRYQKVAELLAPAEGLEWSYVQADLQPFLAVHLPDRVGLYSPSVNYLAWDTSRTDSHRAHLVTAIQAADVLIDPGLESPALRPLPALVPVFEIITSHLDRFPCSIDLESLTIRATEPVCMAIGEVAPSPASP